MTDTQLSFDAPAARVTDPETSHAAARLALVKAPSTRARVLAFLRSRGELGATDFETAEALHVQQTSCGVRRLSLERAGLVVRTEETRRTPSGAQALVFKATK